MGKEGDLYPVKTGAVNVIVKYDGTIVAAIPVTIIGDRITTSLDVNLSKTTLSSEPGAKDKVTVTVTAKDQLGASTINASSDVTFEALGNNPGEAPVASDKNKFEFTTGQFIGVDKATTFQYKVTV